MSERLIGFILGAVAMLPVLGSLLGMKVYWKGKYKFLECMHNLLEDQYEDLYHRMEKGLQPPSKEELVEDAQQFLDKSWGIK